MATQDKSKSVHTSAPEITWNPQNDDPSSDGLYVFDQTLDETFSGHSPNVSPMAGVRQKPMGRGEALKKLINLSSKSGPAYRPVATGACGQKGPVAVPGQCQVQESWKKVSCAPVAYQLQKMMENSQANDEGCMGFCSPEVHHDLAAGTVKRTGCIGGESSQPFLSSAFKESRMKAQMIACTRKDSSTGSISVIMPERSLNIIKIHTNNSTRKIKGIDFRSSIQCPDITNTSEFPPLGK